MSNTKNKLKARVFVILICVVFWYGGMRYYKFYHSNLSVSALTVEKLEHTQSLGISFNENFWDKTTVEASMLTSSGKHYRETWELSGHLGHSVRSATFGISVPLNETISEVKILLKHGKKTISTYDKSFINAI